MAKKQPALRAISKAERLGDFILSPHRFDDLDAVWSDLTSASYKKLNHKEKSEKVNRALLELIRDAPTHTFLLIAVVEFVDQVARKKVLVNYSLSSFELWLNQFSDLSEKENYAIRGKIMGKWVPRDEFQIIFPVGMGKVHPGSHFVTAHSSPDLDTTIASFWGWVDAFGARVSEGLHIWNVPGGAPPSSIEVALLFHHIFGQNVFKHLAKDRDSLSLSSLELMTQRGVIKQKTDQSSMAVDHERTQKAVILIDDNGYYLGDWRSFDVEGVRQVNLLLNNILRWFENTLHINIISLFAKKSLSLKDLPPFVRGITTITLVEAEPASELTDKQKRQMDLFLKKVLGVRMGLFATFGEFAERMKELGVPDFQFTIEQLEALTRSPLFNDSGMLIENRPKIFHLLEEVIASFDRAVHDARVYTEKLKVALDIKTNVFGYLPQVVSYRAEVEELKSKIGNYPYLTVTSSDDQGRMLPLGVIRSRDLHQPILGTVTLRDFCNRDETKIPSYFEVISVIDHHKSVLHTSSAPVAYLSDAQSTNAIVAELAFTINDKYSLGGMTRDEIEKQIKEVKKDISSASSKRILRRLLSRLNASDMALGGADTSYISSVREFVEYLHFLYAIIDDTDLLTKVSRRDVESVAELLNRLKSIMQGKEMEIIHFDDIPRDATFVEKAATRILQHPDMYSVYRKIYLAKEQLIEENLQLAAKGKESSLFVDTKIQNGCCRIGQVKMFANNFKSFDEHVDKMRATWVQQSRAFFEDRREVDLFMQMVCTISGAEDLYSGDASKHKHKDELWIWIPMTEQSIQHLKGFLNEFRASPQIVDNADSMELQVIGPQCFELFSIFKESFAPLPENANKEKSKGQTLAILKYRAGAINSRKAMISPYLPKQLS